MGMNAITPEDAVRILNDAHAADPQAMQDLVESRVPCNENLAQHPTIQVCGGTTEEPPQVGFLGVLNGLFGINHNGRGHIEAVYDGVYPALAGFRVGPTADAPNP